MKFLVFLGTSRDSTPPKPARLGVRVTEALLECLKIRYADHEIELVDVLDYPPEPVFKPHFAYPRSKAPAQLNQLAEKIENADGFVMVSPEYNHSMSPALANLLNHFGSSLFSSKDACSCWHAYVSFGAGLPASFCNDTCAQGARDLYGRWFSAGPGRSRRMVRLFWPNIQPIDLVGSSSEGASSAG